MINNPKCPHCGFVSHPTYSNDGKTVYYVCEKCKAVFKVNK